MSAYAGDEYAGARGNRSIPKDPNRGFINLTAVKNLYLLNLTIDMQDPVENIVSALLSIDNNCRRFDGVLGVDTLIGTLPKDQVSTVVLVAHGQEHGIGLYESKNSREQLTDRAALISRIEKVLSTGGRVQIYAVVCHGAELSASPPAVTQNVLWDCRTFDFETAEDAIPWLKGLLPKQ